MYATHVPIIAMNAKDDSDYFLAVIEFVMATIRRPLYLVKPGVKFSKVQENGLNHTCDYLDMFHTCTFDDKLSLEDKIKILMQIDGLNIPKVSFVLQLTGHEIGCIDTHNAAIMGVDSDALVMRKTAKKYNPEKIWRYIGMCQSTQMGGSQKMWDSWCDFIHQKYPKRFDSGHTVSRYHVEAINAFFERK
ncbi:hypothetical protein DSS3PM1_00008 [Bacteriophage DSS3_PM1]|nr:hypothetical protein DSS3PM1_00008 [Bacteriophage DSS3_PM1]